ncbi:MAG: MoaD/ThiS family protein [Planctomycetaceae bacterium]|nr:MoaD/ThiS family protein [Planctomycetaceae bacterium]
MQVTFQLEAQLRLLSQRASVVVEANDAASLALAMRQLAERHPELRDQLLDDGGHVRRSLLIVVDDAPVHAASADGYTLSPGATVVLLPPISGG